MGEISMVFTYLAIDRCICVMAGAMVWGTPSKDTHRYDHQWHYVEVEPFIPMNLKPMSDQPKRFSAQLERPQASEICLEGQMEAELKSRWTQSSPAPPPSCPAWDPINQSIGQSANAADKSSTPWYLSVKMREDQENTKKTRVISEGLNPRG